MNRMIFTAMLSLLAVVTLEGCVAYRSQVPVATTYEARPQHKMQSAGHWTVLAEDVADMVLTALEDREDLLLTPIYITPPDARPFSVGFYRQLTSAFVSRGMQVSLKREQDVVAVDFDVYGVRHNPRFQRPPLGTLTALSAGVSAARALESITEWIPAAIGAGVLADLAAGSVTRPTESEVLISVAMSYNNRYVMHTTSVYYINNPDMELFVDENNPGYQIEEFQPRPVRVVSQ